MRKRNREVSLVSCLDNHKSLFAYCCDAFVKYEYINSQRRHRWNFFPHLFARRDSRDGSRTVIQRKIEHYRSCYRDNYYNCQETMQPSALHDVLLSSYRAGKREENCLAFSRDDTTHFAPDVTRSVLRIRRTELGSVRVRLLSRVVI